MGGGGVIGGGGGGVDGHFFISAVFKAQLFVNGKFLFTNILIFLYTALLHNFYVSIHFQSVTVFKKRINPGSAG